MESFQIKRKKRKVEIQVADRVYFIDNLDRDNAIIIRDVLAEKVYDSRKETDTDISDIASNLGFKAENIKKIKEHVFYRKHVLKPYALESSIEYKRFDANLQQALAWKKLGMGLHSEKDLTWLKHEFAEQYYERKYQSSYFDSHNFAESRYKGFLWYEKF